MKSVTKEEYYNRFMNINSVLSIQGGYPFTCEWTLRGSQTVIAKSVEIEKDGDIVTEYFIN